MNQKNWHWIYIYIYRYIQYILTGIYWHRFSLSSHPPKSISMRILSCEKKRINPGEYHFALSRVRLLHVEYFFVKWHWQSKIDEYLFQKQRWQHQECETCRHKTTYIFNQKPYLNVKDQRKFSTVLRSSQKKI